MNIPDSNRSSNFEILTLPLTSNLQEYGNLFNQRNSSKSDVFEEVCVSKGCIPLANGAIAENRDKNQEWNVASLPENENIKNGDISKNVESTSLVSVVNTVAQLSNLVANERNSYDLGSFGESETSRSNNSEPKKHGVSSVLVQTDVSHWQDFVAYTTEASASLPRSPGKQKDEASTRAASSLESLPYDCMNQTSEKEKGEDFLASNAFYKALKYNQNVTNMDSQKCTKANSSSKRHFVLRFQDTEETLILNEGPVIQQFEYFSGIIESNFAESKTQTIDMSEHLPYEIARLVLQEEVYIISCTKKTNVCNVIEALDYLGFKYTDEFIHQLYRKIHRHRWTNDKQLAYELIYTCAYSNIGIHLMTYLKRCSGIMSQLLSKKGGQLISEMCDKNFDRTISLLNDICHSLCYWQPKVKDVIEFIIEATQQETLVDALAEIWDPTLWYLTEKKVVLKDALSDGPHQIGDVDIELYADSDNQGSSTTVNISMSGGSPLDGGTLLSQVTNIGIYASPRSKATHVYICFTARAKFKLRDVLLGEATFDLYPDGVKAFCPVVSGGPHMHGLQVTCRIDDKIKEFKDDFRNRYNADIGNQKIDDISVELKSRQFPFRSLSLYLLHNAMLKRDLQFISLFSSALHSDVCEWLGTYLTPLWVQQSFPDDSCSYIAPLNLNSVPSPFVMLLHWFSHYQVPIDAWCSKTIMGELLQGSHFQSLLSKHFYDCLNFIKYCKKWIDSESLLLFREKFIDFVSHKPHIVGSVLFDSSCEIDADQSLPSHSTSLSSCSFYDEQFRRSFSEASENNCVDQYPSFKSHENDSCNAKYSGASSNKLTATRQTCRSLQHVSANASNRCLLPFNKEIDIGVCAASNNLCSLHVTRKPKETFEDKVLLDVTNSVKETGKSKRCKLC